MKSYTTEDLWWALATLETAARRFAQGLDGRTSHVLSECAKAQDVLNHTSQFSKHEQTKMEEIA